MDCCKIDLGNFPHSGEIKTGQIATQNGYHKLELVGPNFAGFTLTYYYFAGAEIVIPQGKLNEDFLYKMKIKQPDGTYFKDLTGECENFIFKTFIETSSCGACPEDVFVYESDPSSEDPSDSEDVPVLDV